MPGVNLADAAQEEVRMFSEMNPWSGTSIRGLTVAERVLLPEVISHESAHGYCHLDDEMPTEAAGCFRLRAGKACKEER